MELKKREDNATREYAKIGDISKKELKIHTPNKWLVASAVGLTTLFYSNSHSILGSIGVVFGCLDIEVLYNYSSTWMVVNEISNMFGLISFVSFIITIVLGLPILFDSEINSIIKKEDKDSFRAKKEKATNIIIIALIITIFAFAIHFLLDEIILELNIPIFYEGGVREVI